MTDITAPPPGTRSPSWPVRVLLVARDAIWGIVDEFLLGAVRAGRIRLAGRTPAVQTALIVTGVILVVAFVSFASGDLFRTGQDLLVLPGGRSGRGTLIPAWLIPATFFLITVSMALLLAGSLHAALPMRITALIVGVLIPTAFMANAYAAREVSGATLWPGWVALAAIPAVFALRWRARERPGAELVVLLLLLTVTFGVAATAVTLADEVTGDGFALRQLALLVIQLTAIAYPLVFVAGLDVLAFGLDASSWSLRFVDRRIGQVAVLVGVVSLGLWRARDTVDRIAGDVRASGAYDTFMPILGAAILVAVIGAWWWVIRRLAGWGAGTRPGEDAVDHSSTRVRLWLAAAFSLITLVRVPVLLTVQVLVQMDWAGIGLLTFMLDVADFLGDDDVITTYRILLGTVLVGVGVLEARRGRITAALLIGTIGLTNLVGELYVTGPLDDLFWAAPEPVDTVWLAVFLGFTVWWMARGRFTEVRCERILFVLVLGALVAQFDFVTDPFGPLIGFTGVGFVVFGLVWGFLTGGGVANVSTPGFPRSSRAYLYLGYSLLSISLLHWSAVTHDLTAQEDIERTGQNGLAVLGYPLVYAVFAVMLAGALANRPVDEDPETQPVPAPPAP